LSKVDLTLSIIILVGAYSGFRDGFRAELFSLLTIFLGVLFGFKLMGMAMVYLEVLHRLVCPAVHRIRRSFLYHPVFCQSHRSFVG
jgi:uncharacterized membrane protein required for colicin V production